MPLNLFHSSADESWASRKFLLVFVPREERNRKEGNASGERAFYISWGTKDQGWRELKGVFRAGCIPSCAVN